MDEKQTLNRFIADINLNEITDIEELKEVCASTDKYLENRMGLVKLKENEIFKKCLRLIDAKVKMANRLVAKSKEAEAIYAQKDDTIRKYLFNKMFHFDMRNQQVLECSEFKAPEGLKDQVRGTLSVQLILTDARDETLRYLLCFSPKKLDLETVYKLDQNIEAESCQQKEIDDLIGHMKSFVGEKYFGVKRVVIEALEKYLLRDPDMNNSEAFINP